MPALPLALYFEHPDWFRPLLSELDGRGTPHIVIDGKGHSFDPADTERRYSLFFNRMSPSARLRSPHPGTFYAHALLAHIEATGTPIVNGRTAYAYETSKAAQLTLLHKLGLPAPRSRVAHDPRTAPEAARALRFPIVVKANVGGSGAGIVRFDTMADLTKAAAHGLLDFGLDGVALVQEYVPARNGHITRVETLGGKFLYAINVYTDGSSFNLCPADICLRADGTALERAAAPENAPRPALRVEGFTPPAGIIRDVERIMQAAQIDVGGLEYMTDDRDGTLVYYDINALSNFVADAPNVVGFEPVARLADYLAGRMG